MEVKKLYYEDSHLQEFTACVTGCREQDGNYLVTLDATAFYPEGGGQACDMGTLDDVMVLDVQEKDGQVYHLCDGAFTVGQQVTGRIDWDRRFDLMQQHSGEHMVSGVISRIYGYHNVGFHVGADVITIDFDGPILPDELPAIQQEVNASVWKDLPVKCWIPSKEELPNVKYRSKRPLPWPVRVVEIPGVDSCACCGVHVKTTGEIGLVVLLSCIKFHEGSRMEMVCGARALDLLCRVYEQNRQVSQAFSAKILETGQAAQHMNLQLNAAKFRAVGLQKQVYAGIAAGYEGKPYALHFEENLHPGQVRELAEYISAASPLAVVMSGTDSGGYNICMAGRTNAVRDLGAALCAELDARGGGKPGFFQGSIHSSRQEIHNFFLSHKAFLVE